MTGWHRIWAAAAVFDASTEAAMVRVVIFSAVRGRALQGGKAEAVAQLSAALAN